MAIISAESFHTSVRHNKIEPVYFLFGEEDLLIEEALDMLIERTVDASTRSFNFDTLFGGETTYPELVERANAYPLMADRRVVVVKEVDRLISMRGKPDPTSPFMRYLEAPAPTTVLVMTADDNPKNVAALLRAPHRADGFDGVGRRNRLRMGHG